MSLPIPPRPCRGFGPPEAVFVPHPMARPLSPVAPTFDDLDRIVVFGGSNRTLDMLRLASVRSDDVILVADEVDEPTRRFIDRFAVEYRRGAAWPGELQGAVAAVVAIGDVERENLLVRAARRQRVPIHVESRPLVSDFTMLELVERRPLNVAR